MTRNVLNPFGLIRVALAVAVGLPVFIVSNAFAQEPAPPGPAPAGGQAEVERVIVTGSNIPTAEETGPNPVDTYRPQDIEKLGVRNATDFLTRLPQEAGGTINQNIANGGDGSVVPNLRGLLPKETLVLIDGKRVAGTGLLDNVDINLIPFPMIDHIDILKDGASALYGTDAVTGVINIFLKHKFRGLEIGGSIGNTNMGASNDARELEGWLIAGTGDDKTDIMISADFYDRASIFSHDRGLTGDPDARDFGGLNNRSGNYAGRVGGFVLRPGLTAPTPHSAPNAATSPEYTARFTAGLTNRGNKSVFNFAAFTPSISGGDRQSFYGSFNREICDKYLEVFADFKYTRSFFDSQLAPAPFTPDPFKKASGAFFGPAGISVPIQNAFNPFTVANATLPDGTPVTSGVRFRSVFDTGNRINDYTFQDMLFDAGLRGQLGEFGDYFKTWNWEAGFRYSRNEEENLFRGAVSRPGLRAALLDTDPATAFNAFGRAQNTQAAIDAVYVTLHNSGTFELPLGYLSINGDLFNLPAGPVSFALGGEYHGERWKNDPDSLNQTISTIGSVDLTPSKVNRDVWGTYQEVRIPVTSPTWNFPGLYSLEIDVAEREEWYSQNTGRAPGEPQGHSRYNTQKPKFSVRLQPLDPKWIGALTLRGTYSEAFHAPRLTELSPATAQSFPLVHDPFSSETEPQVEEFIKGNPRLKPETAYEWSYGAVWSPKWLHGLTLSADWWHIDLRQIATIFGADFILGHPSLFPGQVTRDPITNEAISIQDPEANIAGTVLEGLDYEGIYILDSSIFGHGDWGRLTFTVNGTWLSRFVLQPNALSDSFNIAGTFVPTSFTLTSSLPRNRAYFSVFYDGPADTWLGGFDTGAVVHFTGQYQDDNIDLIGGATSDFTVANRQRKVREYFTLDLIATYAFNLPPPVAQQEVAGYAKDGGKNVRMKDGKDKNVMPVSTAEYNPCGWRAWLNGTTITIGMQNVFDEDPPFVAGNFENNYDESLTDVRGRFWYVQVRKRF